MRLTTTADLGLFAKQDIKCGTRILSEAPLVVLSEDDVSAHPCMWKRLDHLSPAELDQFDSLYINKALLCAKTCPEPRKAVIASGKLGQCREFIDGFVENEVHRSGMYVYSTNRDSYRLYMLTSLTRFRTNATSLGPGHGIGVFPLYSRINHSCTPNMHANFNRSLGRHTVHAIRNIEAGEELLTSYIDCEKPAQDRAKELLEMGFKCCCVACKKNRAARKRDTRRIRLYDINRALEIYDGKVEQAYYIPDYLIPQNPKAALAMAEEGLALLKEEGLVGMPRASMFRLGSRYSLQIGTIEKANAYAQNELEVERMCLVMETEYLKDGTGAGNAEQWIKRLDWIVQNEMAKIRMCEKREKKEQKRLEKKAAKKGARR